jgi:hypothetical protein
MSIWRFCSRGSIQDLIDRGNVNIDAFFIYSLVRDLAEVSEKILFLIALLLGTEFHPLESFNLSRTLEVVLLPN